MKFGKEYASQMVPEWQEAYMDYNRLKTILKEIQQIKQRSKQNAGVKRTMTLYRAFSGLVQRHHHHHHHHHHSSPTRKENQTQFISVNSLNENDNKSYETTVLQIAEEGGEYEKEYFRKLDEEFNKVDKFYRGKMKEVMDEAESLGKQMDALIAFRLQVDILQGQPDESSYVSEPKFEERKLKSVHACKTVPLDIIGQVKINKTFASPASMVRNFVYAPETEDTYVKGNRNKVEKQLKAAFVEFYHKLRHLKSYR